MIAVILDALQLVVHPITKIRRLKTEGSILPAAVFVYIVYTLSAVETLFTPPPPKLSGNVLFLYRYYILWSGPFILLVSWLIPAFVIHSIAHSKRQKGAFKQLLRILIYPLVVFSLLSTIWKVLSLFEWGVVASIKNILGYGQIGWFAWIEILAVREVYSVGTVRALLLILLAFLITPFMILGFPVGALLVLTVDAAKRVRSRSGLKN